MERMTKADVDKLDKGLAVRSGRALRPRDAAPSFCSIAGTRTFWC